MISLKLVKILIIVFFAMPLSSLAQNGEIKDSVTTVTDVVKRDTVAKSITIEDLQNKIVELTQKVNVLSESETKLKEKSSVDERTIKLYKSKIQRLETKLIFADSIVARLSNDCLRKKYDQEKVNNAIKDFDQMYSFELKSKFSRLKTLLTDYCFYTDELKTIFIEVQNDKAIGNPFTGSKHALTYIDKIKATKYYMEVYNDNWTIPYLNAVIDKSIEIIKAFNPKESKELHLLELLH